MEKQFTLTNLAELDGGKANIAINHALRTVVHDINERPGDKANRKVTIEIFARPVLDKDSATLDTANVQIKVKTSVPVRQTTEYPMLVTKDNTLLFSPESPQNPRQRSMFREGVDPETGEVTTPDDDEVQTL